MTRTYFKETEKTLFMKKCELFGADYHDDEWGAIWKMPEENYNNCIKTRQIAICLNNDEVSVKIGTINKECDNFVWNDDEEGLGGTGYCSEEILWIYQIFKTLWDHFLIADNPLSDKEYGEIADKLKKSKSKKKMKVKGGDEIK
jgi:hypothetical protein